MTHRSQTICLQFKHEAVVGGDNCSPSSTSDLLDALLAQITGHYHSSQSRKGEITVGGKKLSEIKSITLTWPVIEFQCTCKSWNWAVNMLNHLSLI